MSHPLRSYSARTFTHGLPMSFLSRAVALMTTATMALWRSILVPTQTVLFSIPWLTWHSLSILTSLFGFRFRFPVPMILVYWITIEK